MKIDITTDGSDLEHELSYFASCCAAFELGTQRSRIHSVHLHLPSAHDADNGRNRHCTVDIETIDGRRIVARDTDLDLHVAIFRALESAAAECARPSAHLEFGADSLPHVPPAAAASSEPGRAA